MRLLASLSLLLLFGTLVTGTPQSTQPLPCAEIRQLKPSRFTNATTSIVSAVVNAARAAQGSAWRPQLETTTDQASRSEVHGWCAGPVGQPTWLRWPVMPRTPSIRISRWA
jgi:hypothetical protein